MTKLMQETVTAVHHWNDSLFSFRTTRDRGFRFHNGHFVMVGLPEGDRPIMRAYSIASANYEEELEFFSIKVPDGPLTSRLQNLRVGDPVVLSKKPTGSLVTDHLLQGRRLYLLATGTGLAPFLSIIKDPEIYERYETVILVHGVRYTSELAYRAHIEDELPCHDFFGEQIRQQLLYYPTVTRESFRHNGRLTELMTSGKLFLDLGLPQPTTDDDRFMICGSPAMLRDTCHILEQRGFYEARNGKQGHYVVERAFVEQ